MTNLDAYLDKFSESGKRVLEEALAESRRRNQNYISVEHVLNALSGVETELFNSTMSDLSIDPRSVRLSVEKRLENSRHHAGTGFRIAPETTYLFKCSMDRARSQGRRIIEASDMFYVLTIDRGSPLNDILQNLGAAYDEVLQAALTRIRKHELASPENRELSIERIDAEIERLKQKISALETEKREMLDRDDEPKN
jgi:ATP-dependent Clp protease ATP-binding subunit ClpA